VTTGSWWKQTTVYQIYPRSFADGSGDGVGDLEGVRSRLDHLQWLGVEAVWLSPIFPSPGVDLGYDVSDYCDIDPLFGDLALFDTLVEEAHARDVRVLLDWVPNHTSDQHPWFVQSRSSRDNPKRGWYVWRDAKPDGSPPNNWASAFGGSAWQWDEPTRQWFLHFFFPQQPDLNWNNPDVRQAMCNVVRFWLDRGVDGFRADVVNLIGKDPALSDVSNELAGKSLVGVWDDPTAYAHLEEVREVIDAYPGDRVFLGEIHLSDPRRLRSYIEGKRLKLVFNFQLLWQPWDAAAWLRVIAEADEVFTGSEAWPTWVLSNHDNARIRTRFGGDERRARVAAVVLLTLRGTPFVFQGDELGLLDGTTAVHRADPTGRLGCRAPIPWDDSPAHGWPVEPWLPWPPEPDTHNVTTMQRDPDSMLHLYRRLLHLRNRSEALRFGEWRALPSPKGTLAYARVSEHEHLAVMANFADEPVELIEPLLSASAIVGSDRSAEVVSATQLAPVSATIYSLWGTGRLATTE